MDQSLPVFDRPKVPVAKVAPPRNIPPPVNRPPPPPDRELTERTREKEKTPPRKKPPKDPRLSTLTESQIMEKLRKPHF